MNKKRTWIVIVTIIVVAALLGGLGGYHIYTTNCQRKDHIAEAWEHFTAETDREKKITVYREFAEDDDLALNQWYDRLFSGSVKKEYAKTLSDMSTWFTDGYDDVLKGNTLALEATSENKEAFGTANTNLASLMTTIKKDKILDNKGIKEYQQKIDKLTTQYDTALVTIEVNEKKAFYDAVVSENTFEDVTSISSKSKLNTAVATLTDTLNSIKSETIFDEDTIRNYETTINSLIESYNNRISAIDENEKKTTVSKSGSINGGSSNGSRNYSNDDNWTSIDPRTGKPYWMNYSYTYTYDPETGEILTYKDNAGNVYDSDYNLL